MKIVEKRGSWFAFQGTQLGQGRAITLELMRKDAELTKKVSDAITVAKDAGIQPELPPDVEEQDPNAGADPDAVGTPEEEGAEAQDV
jgi:hypothetical protein